MCRDLREAIAQYWQLVSQPELATETAASSERVVETALVWPHRFGRAQLLRRTFDIDIQHCPNCCGGEFRFIFAILERPATERIPEHLGLEPPSPGSPAREPGPHLAGQAAPAFARAHRKRLPQDATIGTRNCNCGGDARRAGTTLMTSGGTLSPRSLTRPVRGPGPGEVAQRRVRRAGIAVARGKSSWLWPCFGPCSALRGAP